MIVDDGQGSWDIPSFVLATNMTKHDLSCYINVAVLIILTLHVHIPY